MIAIGRSYSEFVRQSLTSLSTMTPIIFTAETLMRKFEKAKDGVKTTGAAFRELSARLEPTLITDWTQAEEVAMRKRGKALEIYDVALDKGMSCNLP